MFRSLIFILHFLACTLSCIGQKSNLNVTGSYLKGTASIKSSWNTASGREDYHSLNGYALGLEWFRGSDLPFKKTNWSLCVGFKNFGIEGPNSFSYLKQYEKFTFIGISPNLKIRLRKDIFLELAPSLNYLTSFNSISFNSTGRYRTNNYFGQGFNSNSVGFNKFVFGAVFGFRYRTNLVDYGIKWNPAFNAVAYLKDVDTFKLYSSSIELGISRSLLRY